MSDFLTINGTAVPIIPSQCKKPTTEAIDRTRMFNGDMHAVSSGISTARKRQWQVTTAQMPDSTANPLIDLLTQHEIVTVAGDWLGGSVSCWTKLQSETPTTGAGVLYHVVQFTLIET